MDEKKIIKKETAEKPTVKFKGKYISAIGRRKVSVAQVRLYVKGAGNLIVNNMPAEKYFSTIEQRIAVMQPIKLTGSEKMDFSIIAKGGGKAGQADAVRHGIARTLIKYNQELRASLKAKGLLTRDARRKERKKPGLKKARRAPQWSKR
ncbi:MAG: 30S ribosomal protein S9 [bacterium]